jgi:peptidoglycan/LPS O-acetylase OafA/YrhL
MTPSVLIVNSREPWQGPSDSLARQQIKLPAGSSFDEWAILGGTRFLLAMIVAVGHCEGFLPAPKTGWTHALALLNGTAAVYGFLFISGYSIAHSLRHPKGFYLRRARRILPLYWSGLLLGLCVTFSAGGSVTMPGGEVITAPHFWEFVGNVLLLQGWACMTVSCDGPLWTISVEVFYYAIAPLLRSARPWMLCGLIWTCAIAAVLCKQNNWPLRWGYATLMLAWAWFAGFYWYRHRKGTTLVLLLVMGCFFGRFGTYDLADVTIVFAAAVLAVAPSIAVPRLLRSPLLYLGELSYPLYIFHWPTTVGLFALRGVLDPIAWMAGSIGISMLAYHLIDQPFRSSPFARIKPVPA